MAWVAVGRAVKSIEAFQLEGPLEKWRALRDTIHQQVCAQGYDAGLNSFVQSYGVKDLDASLLMIPLVGFLPVHDPRVVGTIEAVQKGLTRDGLLDRYRPQPNVDGLPPREGTFLLCTFWLADCLALMGRHDEALKVFQKLLDLRNDVGLLSEQYDPIDKRMLGNFPQAFSHIGLIITARNLSKAGGPCEHRQDGHAAGRAEEMPH
jgi:GH15 family glucan-1,4-alpha-glucosidase